MMACDKLYPMIRKRGWNIQMKTVEDPMKESKDWFVVRVTAVVDSPAWCASMLQTFQYTEVPDNPLWLQFGVCDVVCSAIKVTRPANFDRTVKLTYTLLSLQRTCVLLTNKRCTHTSKWETNVNINKTTMRGVKHSANRQHLCQQLYLVLGVEGPPPTKVMWLGDMKKIPYHIRSD